MPTEEERRALYDEFKRDSDASVREQLLTMLRDESLPKETRTVVAKEILNRGWVAKPEGPVVQAVTSDEDC